MLNSEVFDIIMGRLGSRSAPAMRSVCIQELNVCIRELERAPTKPWFLEDTETGELTAEQDYILLPEDFLMEVENGTLEVENEEGEWIELGKWPRDKIRAETKNCDPAFPEGYGIWGKRFIFGPAPDQAYSYRFDYYKRTSAVSDNGSAVTNDWLLEFFDYVAYKTLIVVARDHIKDGGLTAGYIESFKLAEKYFNTEVTAREVANATYLLTDEEN